MLFLWLLLYLNPLSHYRFLILHLLSKHFKQKQILWHGAKQMCFRLSSQGHFGNFWQKAKW